IDSSYPVLLENYLRNTDPKIEVFNAGISGNDPFFDFKALQKLSQEFNVHAAVFLVNSTDIEDVLHRGGDERFAPDGTVHYQPTPRWERLYACSYLFRLLIHNFFKFDFCYHTEQEHLQLEQKACQKLHRLFTEQIIPYCRAKNIRLIIA